MGGGSLSTPLSSELARFGLSVQGGKDSGAACCRAHRPSGLGLARPVQGHSQGPCSWGGGQLSAVAPPRLSRCPLTSCQREASGGGTGEVGCIVQRKLDVLAQAPVLEGRVVVGGCSQRKLNCCQLSGGGVNP